MCATDMIFTLVQPINDLRIDLELNTRVYCLDIRQLHNK